MTEAGEGLGEDGNDRGGLAMSQAGDGTDRSGLAMSQAEDGGADGGRALGTVLRDRGGQVWLLAARARQRPLESLAAVLLGLGGAAYPPVWLLGAALALGSRAWDYRDKWIGLAGPVLLLIVGTVAGVSLGSQPASFGSHVHDAWVAADIVSRIAALLGAAYLVWRLGPGRRQPSVPPWNKPHKVG
jgi:hypothetical protein